VRAIFLCAILLSGMTARADAESFVTSFLGVHPSVTRPCQAELIQTSEKSLTINIKTKSNDEVTQVSGIFDIDSLKALSYEEYSLVGTMNSRKSHVRLTFSNSLLFQVSITNDWGIFQTEGSGCSDLHAIIK
jgi:hypothetical protein